jgi:hypothetical protein
LNAKQGYYVATGLSSHVIDVALWYKAANGDVSAVGTFHLDLAKLATAGAVTRREVGEAEVFDVRIVRDVDGQYWLTVRDAVRVPLR